jgi:Fur family ferric uptake transcriptional regulator
VITNPQEAWKQTLEKHIRSRGLRLTRQRLLITETFFRRGGHTTVDDLYQELLKTQPGIGYATVYRTLKLLVECGIAESLQFGEDSTRYEPASEHHDHLICTGCGTIIEFENETIENLQEEIAKMFGFTLTHHNMELYGRCSDPKCTKKS